MSTVLTNTIANVYWQRKTINNVYSTDKHDCNVFWQRKTINNVYSTDKHDCNVYWQRRTINVYSTDKHDCNVFWQRKTINNVYSTDKHDCNVYWQKRLFPQFILIFKNKYFQTQWFIEYVRLIKGWLELTDGCNMQYLLSTVGMVQMLLYTDSKTPPHPSRITPPSHMGGVCLCLMAPLYLVPGVSIESGSPPSSIDGGSSNICGVSAYQAYTGVGRTCA